MPPQESQTQRKRSPWTGVDGACPLAFQPFLFSHRWKRSPGCGPVKKKQSSPIRTAETKILEYLWRNDVIVDRQNTPQHMKYTADN